MQSSCAIKLLAALMVFSFAFAKEANSASPTLTSAHIYDGDLDGFGFTWSTNTYGYYLFLAPGNSSGSLSNDSLGHINYTLSEGNNQFYFFGDWDRGTDKTPPWGLILGFNGASSAFDIYSAQSGISALTTEGASAYDTQTIQTNWTNSFSLLVDNYTIQLTDYNIFVGDTTGTDRVSRFSEGSNGLDDALGSFTLSVTPVPEPEIYAMMGIGLGLMGWVSRRRKQQASV